MLSGRIIQLVHVPESPVCGRIPVSGHGDHSYGVLRDDAGREVYFSHLLVSGLHGFDDLRRGEVVEFTLDDPFLRAASIQTVADQGQPLPSAT